MAPNDQGQAALDKLRDHGRSLILSRGPEVSVDDICSAASCSKGAFYYHFGTKRHFLLGVLRTLEPDKLPPEQLARLLPAVARDSGLAEALTRPNRPHLPGTASGVRDALVLGEHLRAMLKPAKAPGPGVPSPAPNLTALPRGI